MARLFHGEPFVRVAEIEKLQGTLKKLVDFFFADFRRGQELVQIEVRKAAVGHARGQKFPQAAGINSSQITDFFKHHPLQRIVKNTGIEQLADLKARSALDQHGAEEAQRVFLKLKSSVRIMKRHVVFLHRTVNEMIPEWVRLRSGKRGAWVKDIESS